MALNLREVQGWKHSVFEGSGHKYAGAMFRLASPDDGDGKNPL